MSSTASVQNYKKGKKKGYRKKVSAKNAGKVALKMVKQIKKKLRDDVEMKHVQTSVDITPYLANPAQQVLLYPIQGIAEDQRIGTEISLQKIGFRLYLASNAYTGGTIRDPFIVRLMLVQDRDGYGAGSITLTELITAGGVESTGFRNPNYTHRYKVLYDNNYIVNRSGICEAAGPNYTQGPSLMYVEYFKKFKKPLKIQFETTTATSADNNQFYIVAYSPNSPAQGSLFGTVRIGYTDM